jgi:hypothetical protein
LFNFKKNGEINQVGLVSFGGGLRSVQGIVTIMLHCDQLIAHHPHNSSPLLAGPQYNMIFVFKQIHGLYKATFKN